METSQPATGTAIRQIDNIQNTLRALEIDAHQAGLGYDFLLMVAKRQFIIGALKRRRGNQCKAAVDLRMHRNTLSRTIAELKINLEQLGLRRSRGGSEKGRLRKPALSLKPALPSEHTA